MKLSAPAPSRCTLIVLQNSSILIHISQIPEENRQDGELLAQPFLLSPERYTNRHHIEEAKTRRTEVKARSSNNPPKCQEGPHAETRYGLPHFLSSNIANGGHRSQLPRHSGLDVLIFS
jgi:hypothetical protein